MENLSKEEFETIAKTIGETPLKAMNRRLCREKRRKGKGAIRVEEELKSLREIKSAGFEAMEKRLNFMQWFMGAGLTVVSILISLFGLYRG